MLNISRVAKTGWAKIAHHLGRSGASAVPGIKLKYRTLKQRAHATPARDPAAADLLLPGTATPVSFVLVACLQSSSGIWKVIVSQCGRTCRKLSIQISGLACCSCRPCLVHSSCFASKPSSALLLLRQSLLESHNKQYTRNKQRAVYLLQVVLQRRLCLHPLLQALLLS